ncbi:MAG: L,D-transpeptidase family protein [Anaerolineae bacterium]|nr:MAG: L,D-transpeptidase family protein [Anaerolineae bacterium]
MLANPTYHRLKHPRTSYSPLILVGTLLLLALVVGLICIWLMLQTVASYYVSRIYPNVYVMGIKLGRLTPDEGVTLLTGAAHHTDSGLLILRDRENLWSIPWSEAGMQLDAKATVQAAFAVGHTGDLSWRDHVREWLSRHDVAPVFTVNPERARQVLEQLSPSLAISPVDATLRLIQGDEDAVVALPGQPGRQLDIEVTLTRLLDVASGQDRTNHVDLVFQTVPPHIADVTLLQTQVEGMLNRQIELSTYDVLTDETFSWTLGRGDIITWLRIADSSDGPSVVLDRNAIQMTLAHLSAGLGAGRDLRLPEAIDQVSAAFDAGGGAITLYLTHPVHTHVVQPGDSLTSIAAAFGMTSWHLMRANPDVDPDLLHVGQELAIPSQDELTPYLPVPGKRVVVSIDEQRMNAYENGELAYDWPISTGVAKSPTHTGVFQILSKEENAYASLWDLWMPHFVAIYAAGPDFYNGFHGLPTLSSGRRLWEGLLGTPASYGCIILGLEQAETFYQWAEVGVVVVVE